MYTRKYMGDKLYWRTKKNGKWTWRPAVSTLMQGYLYTKVLEEEE